MVELKSLYLDVTIANTWARFSSYTKGDIHKSTLFWSPYSFWQLPYLGDNNLTQIKFVQMHFIVQDNIVALLNKSTYQSESFTVHTSSLESIQQTQSIFSKVYLQSATQF